MAARSKQARKPARKATAPHRLPHARALLVGLTHVDPAKYPRDHFGRPWDGRGGCWGCEHDVAAMRALLEREGYEVSSLLDEAATLEAVLAALKSAASAAVPGDTFLFYYSGHGNRLPDQPDGDEIDGWDETLCLFNGQLRDDDLNEVWLAFPRGTSIIVLSDCCHSGTNYRGLGRSRPAAVDFVRDLNGDPDMRACMLHIGGCRDSELSQGYHEGGAFTTALVRIWDKGRFQGTWDTFHDAIAAAVPESQRPQGNLYGTDSTMLDALASHRPFIPLKNGAAAARNTLPGAAFADFTLESVARMGSAGARDGSTPVLPTTSLDVLGQPGSQEFIRSVQECLSRHGLYDPGAVDGIPGPFTEWALAEFKVVSRNHDEPGVGPRTATALLQGNPDEFFPLSTTGNDFASRIVRLTIASDHWLCRHPDCVNIIYLEGINPDGTPNDDRPDVFNDLRTLVRIRQGKAELVDAWEGTTEPGRRFTDQPMNPKGAARVAFGQYYAWSVGLHNGGHEALRQVKPITVHRDLNQDFIRTGDRTETGVFFINQHWGYDYPVSSLGNSSAGCLVGRTRSGHREFMRRIKADARAEASRSYKFTTTVLDGSNLD